MFWFFIKFLKNLKGVPNYVIALNRTLLVCPQICGKTYLLVNKSKLIRLHNPGQQIKIIARSP